jgi:DNA-binding transcriptional MerR regulator
LAEMANRSSKAEKTVQRDEIVRAALRALHRLASVKNALKARQAGKAAAPFKAAADAVIEKLAGAYQLDADAIAHLLAYLAELLQELQREIEEAERREIAQLLLRLSALCKPTSLTLDAAASMARAPA